jgi:hypothetical protein
MIRNERMIQSGDPESPRDLIRPRSLINSNRTTIRSQTRLLIARDLYYHSTASELWEICHKIDSIMIILCFSQSISIFHKNMQCAILFTCNDRITVFLRLLHAYEYVEFIFSVWYT